MEADYDVIIVGGGIVGLTFALLLARETSLRIALLEAQSDVLETPPAHGKEERVVALSPATMRLFSYLGVWRKEWATLYQKMVVWDAASTGVLEFDSGSLGKLALGYIVILSRLQRSLVEAVRQTPTLMLYSGQTVMSWHKTTSGYTLKTADLTLQTHMLVGADGAHSAVRREAGITWKSLGHNQQALTATVTTELPHQNTAWQCFSSSGPLAFLPLANPQQCSIVWSSSPEQASARLALDDAAFKLALTTAFEARLGKVLDVGMRSRFPLLRGYASHYVKPNLALIGDAAHVIHPLAGQGINLGVMDAAYLAEVFTEAIAASKSITTFNVLRRYERVRKNHNGMMLIFVEMLQRLFTTAVPTLAHLRGLGMNCVNHNDFIKQQFAHYALGEYQDAPKITKMGMHLVQ